MATTSQVGSQERRDLPVHQSSPEARSRWTDWSDDPELNNITATAVKMIGFLALAIASFFIRASFPVVAFPMFLSELTFSGAYANELYKAVFDETLLESLTMR